MTFRTQASPSTLPSGSVTSYFSPGLSSREGVLNPLPVLFTSVIPKGHISSLQSTWPSGWQTEPRREDPTPSGPDEKPVFPLLDLPSPSLNLGSPAFPPAPRPASEPATCPARGKVPNAPSRSMSSCTNSGGRARQPEGTLSAPAGHFRRAAKSYNLDTVWAHNTSRADPDFSSPGPAASPSANWMVPIFWPLGTQLGTLPAL